MALQIEVKSISVTGSSISTGLIITFGLKCWLEGADPIIDDPVINQPFPGYVKTGIPGKTAEELLTEAVKIIKTRMQNCIDKYNREQVLLASTMLETARAWLETNMEG